MLYSKPACPVDNFDKVWIEQALLWFEQKLGKDFIRNKEYLIPANCKFKYQHFDSHEAIQYFIEFICTYIGLDPALIEFQLFWNEDDIESPINIDAADEVSHFVQEYKLNEQGRYEVGVDEVELQDFDATFIALVYKLTYVKLLHKGVFYFENSYMVNYAMVLHGFGILMANTFIRTTQWSGLRYSAWRVKNIGLLNHRVYGYLFAVLADCRSGKDDAALQKYLCADARNFYNQSIQFLAEQNDNNVSSVTTMPIKEEDVFIEKYFHEGGGISLVAHVVDGKYEGLSTFYYPNGLPRTALIYKNNHPFTVLFNYNLYDEEVEKGTLKEGNGTLYIYKPDGNLQQVETYRDTVLQHIEKTG